MATECKHTDREEYGRGLCRPCYSSAQRRGEFKDSDYNNPQLIVDEASFFDDLTWSGLEQMFGRTRPSLRRTLMDADKEDLVKRLNKNSGVRTPDPKYAEKLIRFIESDDEVTWNMLCSVFKDKTAKQMKTTLYSQKPSRADLVRRVTKASKSKHTVTPEQWNAGKEGSA